MKFIETPELDLLSRELSLTQPGLKVSTRIEAYSCKAVGKEKKLFRELEADLISDLSHSTSVSPPSQHSSLLDSAFGPLDQRASRKTLWLLIGLLNVAFPDHDFSKVRPEEFRREDGPRAVLSSLSQALDHLSAPESQRSFSSYPPSSTFAFPSSPFLDPVPLPSTTPDSADGAIPSNPFLRQVLDPIIDLADCEVFSYTPDMDSDPHAAPSDDESDDGDDGDAFERDSDDGGMTWEMDGIDGVGTNQGHQSSGARVPLHSGPSWYGAPSTPMKSFSSLLAQATSQGGTGSAPGTPTAGSIADSEDYFGESSTGGLLWSTNWFLFNKKKKRILFVSVWARSPEQKRGPSYKRASSRGRGRGRGAALGGAALKRSASAASNLSIVAPAATTKKVKA